MIIYVKVPVVIEDPEHCGQCTYGEHRDGPFCTLFYRQLRIEDSPRRVRRDQACINAAKAAK